jgi:hypothetical protein
LDLRDKLRSVESELDKERNLRITVETREVGLRVARDEALLSVERLQQENARLHFEIAALRATQEGTKEPNVGSPLGTSIDDQPIHRGAITPDRVQEVEEQLNLPAFSPRGGADGAIAAGELRAQFLSAWDKLGWQPPTDLQALGRKYWLDLEGRKPTEVPGAIQPLSPDRGSRS